MQFTLPLGSIMGKKLTSGPIGKDVVVQLYHYRQMIAESIDYSGHFRQLMESNVPFRVIVRRFTRELEPVLRKRFPSYIHKLIDAFKLLDRYGETSKLRALFMNDKDIFNVYEKHIDKLTRLFSIYTNSKFKLRDTLVYPVSDTAEAELLHDEERMATVVVNKAKL